MNKIIELKSTKSTLGGRIQRARIIARLSRRQLARKSDISPSDIRKYELSVKCPSSGELLSLSRALDVKVEYFFRPITVEEK